MNRYVFWINSNSEEHKESTHLVFDMLQVRFPVKVNQDMML